LALIITLGWPGSVIEMLNVIAPLSDQGGVRSGGDDVRVRNDEDLAPALSASRPAEVCAHWLSA
jgi:hypothetical protein